MSRPRSYKLLLLGSLAVGKSSVARRLAFDTFEADYKSTIGVQLHKLEVATSHGDISVVVWDTDGDLDADTLSSVYARGASGALIIADVQRPTTIENMKDLCAAMDSSLPGRPRLCVFNKVDLMQPNQSDIDAVISGGDRVALASAMTGEGVQEALVKLVETIVDLEGEVA